MLLTGCAGAAKSIAGGIQSLDDATMRGEPRPLPPMFAEPGRLSECWHQRLCHDFRVNEPAGYRPRLECSSVRRCM